MNIVRAFFFKIRALSLKFWKRAGETSLPPTLPTSYIPEDILKISCAQFTSVVILALHTVCVTKKAFFDWCAYVKYFLSKKV